MTKNEGSKSKRALNILKEKGSSAKDVAVVGSEKMANIAVDGGSKLTKGAVEIKRNIDTKRLGPVYENEIEDIFNNHSEMI